MRVFIDFDNTIVDTTKAFVKWYNYVYSKDVRCEDIVEYDFTPQINLPQDEILKAFSNPMLYKFMVTYEGVYDKLYRLKHLLGCELILVTNCSTESTIRKIEWLEQHKPLSNLFSSKIFVCSNNSYGKSSINMDGCVLIDDHKENHKQSNATYKFAYKKYPNCNWYPKEEDGVLVTNDWETLVNEIKLICQNNKQNI